MTMTEVAMEDNRCCNGPNIKWKLPLVLTAIVMVLLRSLMSSYSHLWNLVDVVDLTTSSVSLTIETKEANMSFVSSSTIKKTSSSSTIDKATTETVGGNMKPVPSSSIKNSPKIEITDALVGNMKLVPSSSTVEPTTKTVTANVNMSFVAEAVATKIGPSETIKNSSKIEETETVLVPNMTFVVPSSTNDDETKTPSIASVIDPYYCEYSPENMTSCKSMISNMICKIDRANKQEEGMIPVPLPPPRPRRVLFLGDSTMGPGFLFKYLKSLLATPKNTCPQKYNCTYKEGSNCNNNELFDLDVLTRKQWIPPKFNEGPVNRSPFCTDCLGCKTTMLECQILQQNQTCHKPMYYGGYMTVEFARDVEIQSNQYMTTQENLIKSYIPNKWNTPDLIQDFNKPVCVVGTGFHDIMIPTITFNVFLENVQWYLSMLQKECSITLWLANTAPTADATYNHTRSNTIRTYPQNQNNTLEWNEGVRDLLQRNKNFSEIGFVDVYKASLNALHQDHIHMSRDWYSNLAKLFIPSDWSTTTTTC